MDQMELLKAMKEMMAKMGAKMDANMKANKEERKEEMKAGQEKIDGQPGQDGGNSERRNEINSQCHRR
jgi:hypothetical protein